MIQFTQTFLRGENLIIPDRIYKNCILGRIGKTKIDCLDIISKQSIWTKPRKFEISGSRIVINFMYKNCLYVTANLETTVLDFFTGNKKNDIKKGVHFWNLQDQFTFFEDRIDKKVGIYNLESFSSIWEKSSDELLLRGQFFGEYIIHRLAGFKNLICYDFYTGNLLWQFNIEEEEKLKTQYGPSDRKWRIDKIIALSNDKLYLSVSSKAIAILDAKTGRFIRLIKQLPQGSFYMNYLGQKFTELPNTAPSKYIASRNIIVGFTSYGYWELSTDTDELRFWFLEEEFLNNEIYTLGFIEVYKDRVLFFLSDKYMASGRSYRGQANDRDRFHLVAFDMVTRKVIYKYNLAQTNHFAWQSRFSITEDWLKLDDFSHKSTYIFKIKDVEKYLTSVKKQKS